MQIGNYNYRYVDTNRDVYAIVKKNTPRHFGQTQFYTVSLKHVDRNCIITFLDQHHSQYVCEEIHQEKGISCEPTMFPLTSLVDFSTTINVPIIVVLNSYCDLLESEVTHELYFAHDYERKISAGSRE